MSAGGGPSSRTRPSLASQTSYRGATPAASTICVPTPKKSSACIAFGVMVTPAPTSRSSVACSNTTTGIPKCCNVSAAGRPPTPPPRFFATAQISLRFSAECGWNDLDVGLGLLELSQTEGTTQPANTAVLVAALREPVVESEIAVRPHGARFELATDPAGSCPVTGEDRGSESEPGGIGTPQRIGLIIEYLEGA